MSAESIGSLVSTKIPGYSDSADIQAALRVYHYGSYEYDPANTSTASLVSPSIAYTLNDLQVQIDDISGEGISPTILTAKGSLISSSASSTPVELTVGPTTGMSLSVNSATATGLEWKIPDVTLSNSVTLTNKTIALGSNTISGTIAQFNTALTDADFATIAGTETLSNKTLTAPKFADLGFIADANGNELVIMDTVTSAVNELTISNAAASGTPTISATGSDTDISLNLVSKNLGTVQVNGITAATLSDTEEIELLTIMGALL